MSKSKKLCTMLLSIMTMLLIGCGSTTLKTEEKQSIKEIESTEANTKAAETKEQSTSSENALSGEFGEFDAYNLDMETVNQDILSGYDLNMINIWGTFCGPCLKEMPDLGEIAREYKDKSFQMIGIAVDVTEDNTLKKAKEIVEKTKADYLHLLPSEDLGNIYLNSVTAVPETLFVDKEGKILKSIVGSRSKEEWIKIIDEMLETVQSGQ